MKALLSVLLLLIFASACAAQSSIDTIQIDNAYVDSSGVDQGYCNNPATPCQSLGYTLDRLTYNNPGCHSQNMMLRGGWNETLNVGKRCGVLTLNGTPGQTYMNGSPNGTATIIANFGSVVQLRNVQVQGISGPFNAVLYAQNGGFINILEGVIFSSAYGAHMVVEGPSAIYAWAPYSIIGGAWVHARVVANGHIGLTANPIIFYNAPPFVTFFSVEAGGNITLGGTSFTGSINYGMQSYSINGNATIWTSGAGCNIIPGVNPSEQLGGRCY